jgi:hypothetical protein
MDDNKDAFYAQLGLSEASQLNKRIAKKLLLEHGSLTSADKKTLSNDVVKLTWTHSLKADTVQVLPYEDADREYLEVALIEVDLNQRARTPRIAELIQRAIPYPVLLILVEGAGFCVSVAHKRFSRAEQGAIVAEEVQCTPWIDPPLSAIDQAFCQALALPSLSRLDFYALYRDMVDAVLARRCADLTGSFVIDPAQTELARRQRLEHCHALERDIRRLRVALSKEDQFAEKVELNTRIKALEGQLAGAKTEL